MGSEEQMHSCCEVQGGPAEFDGSHMSSGISFWLVGKDKDLSGPNVSHIITEITSSFPGDFSALSINTLQVARARSSSDL